MKTIKMLSILGLVLSLISCAFGQMPPGWYQADFGDDNVSPGSASYDFATAAQPTGTWTLTSPAVRGPKLNGASGSHHVWTTLNKDGQITARIVSIENNCRAWVEICDDQSGHGGYASMAIHRWSTGLATHFWYYNPEETLGEGLIAIFPNIEYLPYWVRIERCGDMFTGYISTDGFDWKEEGSVRIPMSADTHIGLAIGVDELYYEHGTAKFDNVRVFSEPNDAYYNQQWNIKNTGQEGGKADADADVHDAWHLTTGSSEIVIAVLDNGIETEHPDLSPNMFINTGEIPGNGLDDDDNGYVDDISGWDFWDWDNDPNPVHDDDNHGTAVTGIAVAKGNNSIGIAGVASTSRFLPVRIGTSVGNNMKIYTELIDDAILYAAGLDEEGDQVWHGADIICIAFILDNVDPNISKALSLAATKGRGGLGCPIFTSSGNIDDGYIDGEIALPSDAIPSGEWSWVISYEKDDRNTAGEDIVCINEVENSDGIVYRFDSPTNLPEGWDSLPGEKGWYIEDNPAHAYGTSRYQLRTEAIDHNGRARIRLPKFSVNSNTDHSIRLKLKLWRSCDVDDIVKFYLYDYNINDIAAEVNYSIEGAVQSSHEVRYPGNYDATITVGASTNFGYRSHVSRYGTGLDFVAPSDGGSLGIYTTDRTGNKGYNSKGDGDYYSDFGKTSAACPFAAGVAALILSKNPNLTRDEVLSIMHDTCDQIGEVEYPNGWNEYYGYGQINAYKALLSLSGIDVNSLP